MPKILTEDAITQYRRDGYFYPVTMLDDAAVARNRAFLEAFETEQGHPLKGGQRNKSHLLFRWGDDLMRTPRILDAVEDLIGSDLLCWNTLFWVKEAGSESFVSWHQDYNYWGLDSKDLVTVWLALSPASVESGCMKVMPGSHKKGSMPHADKYNDDNMLTRGQEISKGVDEDKAVFMPLESGQASFHNVQTAHASGANNTSERRIGLSLHYLPTHAQQTVGDWDSAALVRGEDKYGNFTPAPRPKQDMDPDAVAFHERASGAVRDILFTGADKVRSTL